MPDIKEKLMELLGSNAQCHSLGIDGCDGCPYAFDENCHSKAVADHLIANGVTIQRWISVEERLPEKDGVYLVVACDEGCPYGEGIWYDTVVVMAEYYDDGRWVWCEGSDEYDLCDIVTHWMPLPEPPTRSCRWARAEPRTSALRT